MMSFLEDLRAITSDLVKRRQVFDKEDRKKFKLHYDRQEQSNEKSTGNPTLRSTKDDHDNGNQTNKKGNKSSNLKIQSTAKDKSLTEKAPNDQLVTAGTSKGARAFKQQSQAASTSLSSIRLLTPSNEDFLETVQQKLNPWMKNIAESNLDAVKVKKYSTGFKFAIAKTNLQPGDYVVELRGQILDQSNGDQRVKDEAVKKRHLYTIWESHKCYYIDTTYCRDWAGCHVMQTQKNPNCGLAKIDILGFSKFVFYALETVEEGKRLTFCSKDTADRD